jgi:hypothetical protein
MFEFIIFSLKKEIKITDFCCKKSTKIIYFYFNAVLEDELKLKMIIITRL